MNDKKEKGRSLLSWEAGRIKRGKKAIVSVIVFFSLISIGIIYFIYKGELTSATAFFFLGLASMWYIFMMKKTVHVDITENGFWLDDVFYSFENMKGYWFVESSELFYFTVKGRLNSSISFPMGSITVDEIIRLLPDELVEIQGMGEDLQDRIARIFNI